MVVSYISALAAIDPYSASRFSSVLSSNQFKIDIFLNIIVYIVHKVAETCCMSRANILGMIVIGVMAIAIAQAIASTDISDLDRIVSSFDDPLITPSDLAFFLVTHNYDAVPKDGYVELKLNGESYKLVPNGKVPGLCSIIDQGIMVG
jgi:hypothetical protein